jgi:quinolinate synthetase A subunit
MRRPAPARQGAPHEPTGPLTPPQPPDYLETTMATPDTGILSREELVAQLQGEIKTLARAKNAVILAHNYERAEVQDVADYVGDSLGLSREAAKTDADVIVFCGVHFMAETAAVLSPNKTVLLPDLAAGCSLASTIDAEQLRA